MNHAIKHKSVSVAIKLVLLALLAAVSVILLSRGNFLVRGIVIMSIIGYALLKIRKIRNSRSCGNDEIGYWSGLDDFDIGIFDCFEGDDFDDSFEENDPETKTAY